MRAFSTLMILPRSGILDRAVGELAGQVAALEEPLAAREVARLARGAARPGRVDRLLDDLPRLGRVLLEELGELLVDRGLDERLDLGVAQLRLGLALELRVAQLDRDQRRETLADVFAGEVVLLLLEEVLLARVVVDGLRERGAEAREVRAALGRVDVVGEGEDRLVVRRVPLHRDLDLPVVGLVLEEDDAAVQGVLVAVDVGDEVLDAAGVLERDRLAVGALVIEHDTQVFGEEGRLAQALGEDTVVELDLFEDVGVGHERHRRAGGGALRELLALLELGHRRAALVALVPVVTVDIDVELKPLGERIDHRDADAVQPARDLVTRPAELAAGMEHGEHDLGGRLVVLLHDADRDAAPVVGDGDGVVGVDGDGDRRAVARDGLVDGVVDDLVDEVVQAARPGGADVHARPLANGLEALEDLDVLSVVVRLFHSTSQWTGGGLSQGGHGGPPCPCQSIRTRPPSRPPGATKEPANRLLLGMTTRPARTSAAGVSGRGAKGGLDGRPKALVGDAFGGHPGRRHVLRLQMLSTFRILRRGRRFFLRSDPPADAEAELAHRVAGVHLAHAREDLAGEVGELVRPHRRLALDGQHAAAEGPNGGRPGDLFARGSRPERVGARVVAGRQPAHGRREDLAEAPGVAVATTAHSSSSGGSVGPATGGGPSRSPSSGNSTTSARPSSSSVK